MGAPNTQKICPLGQKADEQHKAECYKRWKEKKAKRAAIAQQILDGKRKINPDWPGGSTTTCCKRWH